MSAAPPAFRRVSRVASTFVVVLATAFGIAAMLPAQASAGMGAPSISSDRPDYAPGDTVALTGDGWGMGEVVHINVNDSVGQTWSRDVDVTADFFGNITDQFALPNWFIASYSVTATGPVSGTATTTFTDGNVKARANPAGTTFALTKTLYTSTNCSTGASTPTTVTGVDSGGNTTGVGSAESVKFEAAANSDQGGNFVNWSSSDPFTSVGPRAICVQGFSGGGSRDYFANYSTNSPPTVGANNASVAVNEGQTAGNNGTYSDLNSGDNVTISASVGTVTKTGTNSGTWSWSFASTDGPAQSQTVTITANDGHGGVTTTTFSIGINNVAPTASFPATRTVNEGGASSFAFTSPSDPSSADTSAGFHFAFSCTGASLSGATYAGSGTSSSVSCSFDDGPSSPTVRARIIDKDGGFSEYTTAVSVDNVAPTASFSNNGPVDEGSSFTLSMTNGDDVSSSDKAAKFDFAFDCGDGSGYGAWSSPAALSASTSCATDDNGSRAVRAKIRDKDGGVREYSDTVTVENVDPTADLGNNGPVDEGSAATVSFSNQDDPSSADTAAGFHYAYSCSNGDLSGATYASSGTDVSQQCTYDDGPSDHTVKARIIDKDGGFSEYTTVVHVGNVAPTADLANNGPVDEGSPATFSFSNQDDPSSADTAAGFHYAYSCSNGDLSGATYAGSGTDASQQCTYPDGPSDNVVKARIIDQDGGFSEYTTTVHVNNVAPRVSLTGPATANEGESKTYIYTVRDPGDDGFTVVSGYPSCGAYGTLVPGSATTSSGGGSFQCHFADGPQTTLVAIKVEDDDGAISVADTEAVDIIEVQVANLAPSLTAPANQSADEGTSETFDLGSFTDDGVDDSPWSVSVDWGDGSSDSFDASSQGPLSHAHTYDDNGTYTVTVKVTDKDGAPSPERSFEVSVANVAPTASSSNNGPVDEGSSFTLSMTNGDDVSSSDKAAKFDFAFDCGDGSGYGAWSSPAALSASTSCATDDNGSRAVRAKIRDKDGGVREYSDTVTVENVDPTATFNAPDEVTEGSDIGLSLTDVQDPGSADTHQYRFSCDGGGTWTAYGNDNSHSCPTSDNATRTVKGQVGDDDGGESAEYSKDVTVKNVAPTADLANNGPVDEGSPATASFSNQDDPSSGDTAAGFHYAYSCSNGDLSGATYAGSGTSDSVQCSFDDGPSDHTVKARIIDKDGGFSEYTTSVHVRNVAPTASFSNDGPVDEGSPATVSVSNQDDPSSADTAAGFHYAYSCSNGDLSGATYAGSGSDASHQCSYDDGPSPHAVTARIIDKDGGFSEYTTEVVVRNVAPIADLANNGPVDEGSPATVSFSNQDDASSADTAAGFRYEYHCDGSAFAAAADYDGADTSASHQCTYPDGPSDHLVRARIIDKDGGATEYTTSVHVVNVAPRVSLTGPNTANEGESKTYTYTVRDPGEDDFTPAPGYPSCGANGTVVPGSETTNAAGGSFQCHFADGPKTTLVAIKVEDSDGAMSVADSEAVDIIEVTVANVAPSLAAPANQSASEGTGKTFELGSFSDDGVDDSPWTVDVDWGDGGSDSFTVSSQGALSHSHTYADNGTYTVKVKVTDKDGAPSPERSFEVSVANVAANLTGAANQTANEGTSKSFALGSFSDDGADDGPWMVAVNWGDGSETFQVTTQGAISRSHTYDDNGTYTVKVKVTDKDDGASEEKSFQVTVDNVAPTASFSNNGPVDEGSSFTLSMTNGDDVSSADKAAKFEFAFDCGDGSGYGPWSSPAALADSRVCSTDDNGSRAVKAKIRDKDGGVREYSDAVTVKNVAPSATFNAPDEVNEGDNINVSLTSPSDPSSADTAAGFTYAFDCGSGYGAFAASNSASCPTTDDGTKTVKGKIRDKDGGEREYTKQVTVGNVAPQVTIVSPTFGQLFAKPANVPLTASFTDSGTGDTHTCSINWDDGTSSAGNVTEANGSGTCSKTYTYYTAGVYTIKVTVTDDEGAKGTAEVMIVVYDQSAGFVTGGGWIDVAAGSYRADPTLAGRANFGFTSKYKNGASTPTGETEFNFQVGNFKFHSANYQWLVVSGFKAQYKGTGEVNGVPGYDFRLTAYDGDLMSPKGPDKFRIKITKQGSGELVFDNRLGKGDDIDVADPQAISGGSIVIHKA